MSKNRTLIGATWCGPCKRVKGYLDSKDIEYTYVDIDTEAGLELARDWAVRSVPTMSIDGKIYTGDTKIMEMFN
jgi:glutaredoxin